jgi:hypothetical protein
MSVESNTYVTNLIDSGNKASVSLHNLYDTILVTNNDDSSDVFRVPWDDFFLKYKEELSNYIQLFNVPESMYYNPKMVSFSIYGTTELWLALLRVNNMRNVTEFHKPIIKIYNQYALNQLIDIYFKREGKK